MSNELELGIISLAQAIAADIKSLRNTDGELINLTTIDKSSLVGAINELMAATPTGVLFTAQNLSDVGDVATARTNIDVRSTLEITNEIAAAIATVTLASLNGLTEAEVDARAQAVLAANVGAAPEMLNTIQEIAAELEADNTAFAALSTTVGTKVSYTTVQALTAPEKVTACTNIGVGDPTHDFTLDYTTARDA